MEAQIPTPTEMEVEEGTLMVEEEQPSGSKNQSKATKTRNRTTQQGRPRTKQGQPNIQYAMRTSSIPVYCKWSEHKRTFVALELQFCFERVKKDEKKPKSKKSECGFLMWNDQTQTTVNKLVKDDPKQQWGMFPCLQQLLFQTDRTAVSEVADRRDLADMVELALSIKHSEIVHGWKFIYEHICRCILSVKSDGSQFVKAVNRREWQAKIVDELIRMVEYEPKKFECLTALIMDNNVGRIEVKNLLKMEAYCFLAEYYNFRINEYFAKAFEPPDDFGEKEKSKKKAKGKDQNEYEKSD